MKFSNDHASLATYAIVNTIIFLEEQGAFYKNASFEDASLQEKLEQKTASVYENLKEYYRILEDMCMMYNLPLEEYKKIIEKETQNVKDQIEQSKEEQSTNQSE